MNRAAFGLRLVWLALVLTTIGSWWIAEHHDIGELTVLAVMAIALVKCRLVFLHFMELKSAPVALRLFYEIWIVACVGMILMFQWGGDSGAIEVSAR